MKPWGKILIGIVILVFGIFALRLGADMPIIQSTPIPRVAESIPTTAPTLLPVEDEGEPQVAGVESGREIAIVKRVVDGDTIELEGGRKLRYIGIDTPETVDPRKPVQCIGPEATKKNIALVEGKQVELEKDVSETDRLGRLLRYVYVDGVMVNDTLVREGFANSSKYPPDVKYQIQFDEAEESAKQNKWGIWSHVCANPTPAPTVAGVASTPMPTPVVQQKSDSTESSTTAQASEAPAGECVIKGNINSKNEYIYHLPGCGSYNQTQIDSARGEKYFCTEAEAKTAGWRKAGNC